ncbi:MAG: flagellar motor protein MotB [Geminicoccaceae bacterium]
MSREPRPIVIRRPVVAGGHGHHGGAWKVAYADFVTAMMAFFLLLWLISSASDETKKGLADFFSNATVNIGPPGGVGGVLDGMTVLPSSVPPLPSSPFDRLPELPSRAEDEEALEPGISAGATPNGATAADTASAEEAAFSAARASILGALQLDPTLRGLKDRLRFEETPEGLRVEILDGEKVPMFPIGSDAMFAHTRRLLEVVARAVADLPNRISIRGHTDSLPFAAGSASDNWRLSADRANATRLALIGAGLAPARVAEVVGKADAEPLVAHDPADPSNRRISVVLLRDSIPAERDRD